MPEVTKATDVYFTLNNGKKIPALGLGTVPSGDPSGVKDQVKTAVKAGFRLIDTAWYYGTEKYVGEALKELFEEGVVKREDIFITTKVWPSFYHNPEKSLNQSLETLGLDYVDLFLQHWPIALSGDENGKPPGPKDENGNLKYDDDPVNGTKFIEVYKNLEKILETTNKTKSIGISNYSLDRLKKLLPEIKITPVVNQIEFHPQLSQQKDLIEFSEKNNIRIECYSGYGGTGAPLLKLPLVKDLASKYNVTENEIINAYDILEGRIIIPRSSNLERIKNITKLPQLTKDELKQLDQLGEKDPKRYVNDPWGYGIGFKGWEGDKLSEPFEKK
ncbi:ARA1 [Candida pseudojiufengensis]|uniref:ARA1 n=1 Tax=Candida pseudojiufengensis TaxID=497109 RepID=UPI002225008D|nr:ARA1 [Candida pseudojiufengensis]KAI5966938.1 ARA1 [Candida pseudojiufengensis]